KQEGSAAQQGKDGTIGCEHWHAGGWLWTPAADDTAFRLVGCEPGLTPAEQGLGGGFGCALCLPLGLKAADFLAQQFNPLRQLAYREQAQILADLMRPGLAAGDLVVDCHLLRSCDWRLPAFAIRIHRVVAGQNPSTDKRAKRRCRMHTHSRPG